MEKFALEKHIEEIARKMLVLGDSVSKVADITDLSVAKVKKLKAALKQAP